MIFGERGVGKTSMANVVATKILGPVLPVRVNCDTTDTYSSLWMKVFERTPVEQTVTDMGLMSTTTTVHEFLADRFRDDEGGGIVPDDVCRALEGLPGFPIIIVDEFDRIMDPVVKQTMADTIKTLSDYSITATVVLVGVADSVDQLIEQHHSIDRALVQIQMPRMSVGELYEIVDNGLQMLGMAIDDEAKHEIAAMSKGLPHYTHLLALHAARTALDSESMRITPENVEEAILKALEGAQETIRSAYHKATMSTRTDTIYPQVLLACALAETDEFGYFAPGDVRSPLSAIMQKAKGIASFSRHLHDFCGEERGGVLEKTGAAYRFRFRFINPLMQPYVIMQGRAKKLVDRGRLDAIEQLRLRR